MLRFFGRVAGIAATALLALASSGALAQERVEARHVLVGPGAEAQGHDNRVRRVERGRVRQRPAVLGIDRPVGIDREEHRSLEAVQLVNDLC